MSKPKATQLAVIQATQAEAPARLIQLAIVSLMGPPAVPANMTQLAVISVAMNNRKTISLGNPISLQCWQPCTSYGTLSTIFYLG